MRSRLADLWLDLVVLAGMVIIGPIVVAAFICNEAGHRLTNLVDIAIRKFQKWTHILDGLYPEGREPQ